MKNQDKFGYDIYDGVFRKMLNYAKRLEEIGFQESHSKPNLLYYISERFSVFADMRGYKDDWGRFIPIWDKERKGKPQFYHQITYYSEKYIGEINRNLWNLYQKIKKQVEFIIIDPFGECPNTWTWMNSFVPASQFFLRNDSQPLLIGDNWEFDVFYNGKCRGCDKNLKGKKIFCEQCEEKYYNLLPECPICGRKFELKDLLSHLFSVPLLSFSEILSRISKLSNEALIESCPHKCGKK
jgi:hypothetical protein